LKIISKSKPDSDPADIPNFEKIDNAGYQPDNVLVVEKNCPELCKKLD